MLKFKNILVNLNVSNDSNFESDSGYIFQKLIWRNLCEASPDTKVYFVGHKQNVIPFHPNVTMLSLHDKYDKFSTRFHFDWHGLKEVISKLPPIDLVINNQPEHSLGFKMLVSSLNGNEIPIVSYYHYLPFHYEGENIKYDESQNLCGFSAPYILGRNLESMELSNLSLVGSEFGASLLRKAYKDKFSAEFSGKLEVFAPPIEANIFESSPATKRTHRILLNQRLYKHYGIYKILEILQELAYRHQFTLVVTDPTGNRSTERNKLDPRVNEIKEYARQLPFVRFEKAESREDYHKLLSTVDFGIAPWKPSALWSMAIADLLAAGKPVICQNEAAFPELLPVTPEFLVSDNASLKAAITSLLSGGLYAISPDLIRQNVLHLHETCAARHYSKLVNSL